MKQPELFDIQTQTRFEAFHEENPHVYEMWKKLTWRAVERGYQHIGAKLIGELIRWETGIMTTGTDYKFPNQWTPYYARKFMKEFPQHEGLFRTRTSKADEEM